MRSRQRIIAFILAVFLVLCQAPLAYAADNGAEAPEQDSTLHIGTAQELLAFAQNCVDESFSQNLHVIITADLDLSGTDFSPIPIFCGTLDGGGYAISGFTCEGKGSNLGLFRYLTESAVLRNLHVSGSVKPVGTASTIGILAGHNEGSITGCTVSGVIAGEREVGGLVGRNGETGRVSGCKSEAAVSGKEQTGMVGLNEGSIADSVNSGNINSHNDYSFADTGGIAGRSSGWIEGCENRGEIGYEQNGYNSGGIAGFHSGVIVDCRNEASVLGRKDIGGIVGQFEPNVDKLEHESKLDKLDREMDSLSSMFREFSNTLDLSTDATKDNVDDLKNTMDETKNIIKSAQEEASGEWGDTKESIDAKRRRLEREIDDLTDSTDAIGSSVYRNIQNALNAVRDLRSALDAAKANADGTLLAAIESMEVHLDAIESELATIRAIIGGILEGIRGYALGQSGMVDLSGGLSQMRDSMSLILQHGAAVVREVAAVSDELADACGKTPGYFSGLADALETAVGNLNNDIHGFGSDAVDNLEDIERLLFRLADTVSDQMDSTRERVDTTADSLEERMDTIQSQVDRITDSVSDHTDSLVNITDRIIDQLDVIRDTAINEESGEFSVDDISGEWNGSVEAGSIVTCVNTGDISGDYHVGGIVGMVAHEMFEDPEVDLELSDTVMGNVTALVRATLRNANNSGSVTAKNNYAGGIAGRADVGAVIDTISTGNVETTDGDYCGGIAGASGHIIRRSHSLGSLTGNDSIGGIAGRGRDIQGCYAMVTIHSDGEKLGAVAGSLADGYEKDSTAERVLDTIMEERPEITPVSFFESEDDENEPEVLGNFFLAEDIAGIDGINYTGQAEPLPYEEFIALEGLPEDFLHFGVTFVADGKVVRSIPLCYGDAFDTALIPPCPEMEGQVGRWPDFDVTRILRNIIVEAEYIPWLTSIFTGEPQPLLLVEGRFSGEAVVEALPYRPEDSVIPKGYTSISGYFFSVTDHGEPVDGAMTIRVRPDVQSAKILWIGEGGAVLLDCAQDGNYLVAETPGSGSFAVVKAKSNVLWIVFSCVAFIAMVMEIIRRKQKHNTTAPKNTANKFPRCKHASSGVLKGKGQSELKQSPPPPEF